MADTAQETQKKPVTQVMKDWIRRIHTWLMTEESIQPEVTPTTAITTPNTQENFTPSEKTLDRITLTELLWGRSWHLPMGAHMTDVMVRAFGLNKEMTVLDLTAGLGGAGREITRNFQSYVIGFEPDPTLAAHGSISMHKAGLGKHVTIEPYAPEKFQASTHYDSIIFRELLYRLPNQAVFIKQIALSLKEQGHVSWTDFILTDEADINHPAIANWLSHTAGSQPLRLAEIASLWEANGMILRTSEDRTTPYADAIMVGLQNIIKSLQQAPLAAESRALVMKEVDFWGQCIVAFGHGLRLYRFYADRK